MASGPGGVTEPRDRLGKPRSSVQQGVAGIETSRGGTAGGHLGGGGAEARCIVGDVVCLPALLFDQMAAVAPDSRKEVEALNEAPPSLPGGDVELHLQRFLDVPVVGGNLHHHSGLKAEGHGRWVVEGDNEAENMLKDVCVLMFPL